MSEKEFPPSIKQLAKARREGSLVQTKWLLMAISWSLALPFALNLFNPARQKEIIVELFHKLSERLSEANFLLIFRDALTDGVLQILSLSSLVALGAIVAHLLQTQFFFSGKGVGFSVSKINPQGYLSRIKEGTLDTAAGLCRIGLLFGLIIPNLYGYLELSREKLRLAALFAVSSRDALFVSPDRFTELSDAINATLYRGVAAVWFIAAIGYVLRWRRFMKQHRMSLQEVRDEYRDSEGDQHFKSLRRNEHQSLAVSEMAKQVKRCKVIVVKRIES